MEAEDATVEAIHEVFDQRNAGNNILDRYLEQIESVRGDAIASYEAVRLCDEMSEDLNARAHHYYSELAAAGQATTPEDTDTKSKRKHLKAAVDTLNEAADLKVAMLDHCYEAVDLMVKDLDKRMRYMEALLRQQSALLEVGLDCFGRNRGGYSESISKRTRTNEGHSSHITAKTVKTRTGNEEVVAKVHELVSYALSGATSRQKANTATGAGDATIDPSEPLYCTCRQVAFGDMIACDNPDCRIEWFHCQCVGIARGLQPSQWYCKDCQALIREGKLKVPS